MNTGNFTVSQFGNFTNSFSIPLWFVRNPYGRSINDPAITVAIIAIIGMHVEAAK